MSINQWNPSVALCGIENVWNVYLEKWFIKCRKFLILLFDFQGRFTETFHESKSEHNFLGKNGKFGGKKIIH